jgi:CheY-like chemotaxis protein
VIHNTFRLGISVVLLAALGAPALSQEFYKKPETTAEFWHYMNHEIEIGQYKVAAGYLKSFIAKNPTDEELLAIQDKEGSSAFLRLLTIPELRNEAKPLVERVNELVRKHLSDRKRLDALIKSLDGSREERAYAIAQLQRSGASAMPALIDALIRTANDLDPHAAILGVLPLLDRNTVPPLLAALDVNDAHLRVELLDVIRRRADTNTIPFLWYYAASRKQPDTVRRKASAILATFLHVPANSLPSAKVALTDEAERYHQHRVKFTPSDSPTVWSWDGSQLVSQQMTASQAEEHFGLRFARQALDLDPGFAPAQVVFLSLALDKGVERAGPDQPLSKASLALKELLTAVNPDLLTSVLDKGLKDHRTTVVLGAVRGLGELAEVRAARSSGRAAPALVRALNYPDRRVQMAAIDALLRIPGPPAPLASARVVDLLRRFAGADGVAKVLVADSSEDRGSTIAAALKQAGYESVTAHTGREALKQLAQSSDFDALIVEAGIADPQLPYLVAQLRSDVNVGLLPLIVMTSAPERIGNLERLLERYPNTWVIPATSDVKEMKSYLAVRITEAMGKPLTDAERKDYAVKAMEWLARLSRGEVPGYDVRPAEGAIIRALHNKALASQAVEATGRLPGREPQIALAGLVLEPNQPEALRSAAAIELCRHIQQYGLLLRQVQAESLQALFATMPDSKLKANVSLVIGSMRPDARQTGERLLRYAPTYSGAGKPETKPQPVS